MKVLPLAGIGVPDAVARAFEGASDVQRFFGGADRYLWFKPWYVAASPYTTTAWIDCDAVVLRPLSELFKLARGGMVVVPDVFNPSATPNDPKLYERLPVPSWDNVHGVNGGVVVLWRDRDADILEAWKQCILGAAKRPEVAEAISFQDQGALLWAIHKTDSTRCITKDTIWNHPANGQDVNHEGSRKRYRDNQELFNRLRADHPGIGIVHWMAAPKLWEFLSDSTQCAMIASLSRSGSQMLQLQLDSVPGVKWLDERLNPDHYPELGHADRIELSRYIDREIWSRWPDASVLGFRWHLWDCGREALMADKDLKVIILERKNLLRWVASYRIGSATQGRSVLTGHRRDADLTLRVPPEEMRREFRAHEAWYAHVREDFRDHQVLEVSYETLIADPYEWRRVAEFLKIEPTSWSPPTIQQERRPMRKIFENFDELKGSFAGTPYAWMFEEQEVRHRESRVSQAGRRVVSFIRYPPRC